MTDEEYKEILASISAEYLKIHRIDRVWGPKGAGHLFYDMEELIAISKFRTPDPRDLNLIPFYTPYGDLCLDK